MEVLRAGSYRRMPWKNGGGETFEIATSPPAATPDTMDWRVSMAIVAGNGAFSSFPGVDRTLTILQGEGLRLELEGHPPALLSQRSAPFPFDADIPTHATLVGGVVTDFNVMTRRGRYGHRVSRIVVNGREHIGTTADAIMVFCCAGTMTCKAGTQSAAALQDGDSALFRTSPRQIELVSQSQAEALLAEFYLAVA